MRNRWVLAGAVVALVSVVGCSGDDDDSVGLEDAPSGSSEESGSGSGAASTTTSEASSETTSGPGSGGLAAGPHYDITSGPSGAGCTPGDVTSLPDGWWAGMVEGVEGDDIVFDLICYFAGDAGAEAAAEDGQDFSNDYYVRNENSRTFQIAFAGDAGASCVELDTGSLNAPCDRAELVGSFAGGSAVFPLVWVHMSDGQADFVYQQYQP